MKIYNYTEFITESLDFKYKLDFPNGKLYEEDEAPPEETTEEVPPPPDEPTDDMGGDIPTDEAPPEDGTEEEEDETSIYRENPEYRIDLILSEIAKKIKYWFKHGKIKKYYKLEDISKNQSLGENNIRMYIQFSNESTEFYSMQFMIRVTDAREEIIDKIFLEIKKYNYEKTSLDTVWMNNIKMKNVREKYILKKIKQMKNREDLLDPPKSKKQADDVSNDIDDFKDMFF
jgi:hypothetical protein